MRVWSANGSKRNICAVHSVEKLLELATSLKIRFL
jgi:hypothetical protein